jgi:hypothetical protein
MRIGPVLFAVGGLIAIPFVVGGLSNVVIPEGITQAVQSRTAPLKVRLVPPLDARLGSQQLIELTAIVDSVDVQSVTVNRGNCEAYLLPPKEFDPSGAVKFIRLKYGQTTKIANNCKTILSEVIKTDLGEWSYSFND